MHREYDSSNQINCHAVELVLCSDDDMIRNCPNYTPHPTQSIAVSELEELRENEKAVRRLLWLYHGHEGLYGDDGQMQCSQCFMEYGIDYKDSPIPDLISAFKRELNRPPELRTRLKKAEGLLERVTSVNEMSKGVELVSEIESFLRGNDDE
jgi:hypothetical protein